jgi:hypothetical protein
MEEPHDREFLRDSSRGQQMTPGFSSPPAKKVEAVSTRYKKTHESESQTLQEQEDAIALDFLPSA